MARRKGKGTSFITALLALGAPTPVVPGRRRYRGGKTGPSRRKRKGRGR